MSDSLVVLATVVLALVGIGLTLFEVVNRRRSQRKSQSLSLHLTVRKGADMPDLWAQFNPTHVFLDTPSRAVLRGQLGSVGECVVKISVNSGSGPAESFGIFREAFVLSWLAGTGAPQLIGMTNSRDGRSVALAMTAATGSSVSSVLTEIDPPKMSDIFILVTETCERISDLHRRGFVHGDIKPSNLICDWQRGDDGRPRLRPIGQPTIVDYESASLVSSQSSEAFTGTRGSVRGTQGFTAPERFYRFDSSPCVDVYSCGVLAGFLLTMSPRRPGSAARARIPLQGWRDLIVRSTSVNPQERPSSIEEFLREWRRGFSSASIELQESEVRWPTKVSERLAGLREAGALKSVLEYETIYPGSSVAWELRESLDALSSDERAKFDKWVTEGPDAVRLAEIDTILKKLELSFFRRIGSEHPELSTILGLDTA